MRGELDQHDILITAPNNMQVNRLQKRIGHKASIGTVDPFQEREAPVANSRAQCLSIVVRSPQLAAGISNSIENGQRLSRLCRLMDADSTTDGQEVGA